MILDEIKSLVEKLDSDLPYREEDARRIWRLDMTRSERNMIVDALTVLYGIEANKLAVLKPPFGASSTI